MPGGGIRPGSAARDAEERNRQNPVRNISLGVRPGSAAREAEERARNSEEAPFNASVGFNLSRGGGVKFELETRPSGPGEAMPVKVPPAEPVAPAAPAAAAPVAAPPQPEAPPAPSAAAKVWGKFRGWFSSNK